MKKWEWNLVYGSSGHPRSFVWKAYGLRKRPWKGYTCKCRKAWKNQPHLTCSCRHEGGVRPTVKARLWWRDKGRHEYRE